MSKVRNILRDFFRFYFKRNKNYNISNISLWKFSSYSIDERILSIKKLKTWIINNNYLRENHQIINQENYYNNDLFLKNYYEFNSKKMIRIQKKKNEISIHQYSLFSKKLLKEYEKSKNIQFLNTSLKVNDFLLYCQLKSNDDSMNGAISSYFPCYFKSFVINYFTNELILKNIEKELLLIKEIKNENKL